MMMSPATHSSTHFVFLWFIEGWIQEPATHSSTHFVFLWFIEGWIQEPHQERANRMH
jgi:hypothetical protein